MAAAALLSVPVAAQASESTAAGEPVVLQTAASPSGGVSVQSQCTIKRGAHVGGYICEYNYMDARWSGGRLETFIIGWDRAMWHTYQRFVGDTEWSPWESMGGGFTSGITMPVWGILQARGLDNKTYYCNQTVPGGWSGWFAC